MVRINKECNQIVRKGREKEINKYIILEEGPDGNPKILFAYLRDDETKKVAIKRETRLSKAGKSRPIDELPREFELCMNLEHKNIVQTIEIINDPAVATLYMVQEYMDGGQLMTMDKKKKMYFDETGKVMKSSKIKSVFRDIFEGLVFLKDNLIAHRDIKPENILVDSNGVAKIADFGISDKLVLTENGNIPLINGQIEEKGSVMFFAPEVLKTGVFDGFAADLWAAGICFYAASFGHIPHFKTQSAHEIRQKIVKNEIRMPGWHRVRKAFRFVKPDALENERVIKLILKRDPKERLDPKEVLEDSFFQ
eukprot:maker-scaffold_9-snap-gene-4.2-mRNA-1 protein AED:0.05 eAED:0.05 QI:150/1/1/1/1/1/5/214/308